MKSEKDKATNEVPTSERLSEAAPSEEKASADAVIKEEKLLAKQEAALGVVEEKVSNHAEEEKLLAKQEAEIGAMKQVGQNSSDTPEIDSIDIQASPSVSLGHDPGQGELVPQVSLRRSTVQQQPIIPGAWSHAPGGRMAMRNAPFNPDHLEQQQMHLPVPSLPAPPPPQSDVEQGGTSNPNLNPDNLAVANEVSALDAAGLPVASVELQQEQEETYVEKKPCGRRSWIGFAVGISVGFLVGVLVFVVTNKDESSATSSSAASTNKRVSQTKLAEKIRPLLPEYTQDAMIDPKSPQSLALRFLVEDPYIKDYPDWRIRQRFALATFYHSTDGPNWKDSTDWLSYEVHECQWYARPTYGFGANNMYSVEFPYPCEDNVTGSYRNLWLYDNDLRGTLPLEMSLLTELQAPSLYHNFLTGTIPSTFANMTNLQGWYLQGNDLTGALPDLSRLTNILIIHMEANRFSGTLPSELGLLSNMFFFQIGDNNFTSTIPTQVGQLPNLWGLWMSRNELTGTIPTEVGSALMTDLTYLDLSRQSVGLNGTGLTGTIPTELSRHSLLRNMYLNYNQLSRRIPSEFGLLTKLTTLELQHNNLEGEIPDELMNALALKRLWMEHNDLSGTVPTSIVDLRNLSSLDLSGNPLEGSFPFGFGDRLRELNISGISELIGSLPDSLCGIRSLDFGCSENLCGCDCGCPEP